MKYVALALLCCLLGGCRCCTFAVGVVHGGHEFQVKILEENVELSAKLLTD